ncbi:hypothetical protein J2Y55_004580 [Bosea sp. BE125]|uniref:hypothetical protein n=1 Tax=Bosea sp. BE125 TaxID=2817909 RepID=UPI00285DDC1E|nr:hypothetical protein [Bosea sp. BE125]MDR6873553.1 hypothetical protein [Bosea sp. BE125]
MTFSADEVEKLKEAQAYEEYEAQYLAGQIEAHPPVDHLKQIAFWMRWCGLCLTIIVLWQIAGVVAGVAWLRRLI